MIFLLTLNYFEGANAGIETVWIREAGLVSIKEFKLLFMGKKRPVNKTTT